MQVVLHILCQRYALFPTGTKRKVIKDNYQQHIMR